jgi:hypothetical protein
MSASLVTNAILDTAGVQYDMDKFIYLGSPVSIFHYIFLTRKEAGLNSLEKLRAATETRIGGRKWDMTFTSPGGCSPIYWV